MISTNTIVIGASISGLASAGCLTRECIEHIIIEKKDCIAYPWRNHYDRLHLHSNKKLSGLPYMPFGKEIPKYPSKKQVIDYLESYAKHFDIRPHYATEALEVSRSGDLWIVKTNRDTYQAKHVVMATGTFGKPRKVDIKGMETFPGKLTHSFGYRSGSDYKGEKVLVVGFGNSACEIAIDLHEQGATPSLSVRSAVNVLPRDVLGIPILQLGVLTSKLPPRFVDKLNAPLIKLLLGDITKLGLKKLPYGPLEQINVHQQVPLLDIGTLKLMRQGHIGVFSGIDHINGKTVHFDDGKHENFDHIVAAIGYDKGWADQVVKVDQSRFDDLVHKVDDQKLFGKDGLYFCGFWVSPTGQIREISHDAVKIVADIVKS